MKKTLILLAIPLILNACARNDYHGMDPKIYNEVLYPKTNTVKENAVYQSFYFAEDAPVFSHNTMHEFDAFLARTYPGAADYLEITFGSRDQAKELYVVRSLRARGFKKSIMQVKIDRSIHADEVVVEMGYTFVESPRCPDWRKSPVTNYSNTNYSNSYCATSINLGQQMANPRDLDGSKTTHVSSDAAVSAGAIGRYRSGEVIVSDPGTSE